MGKILIFSEMFELRELLAQDFAAEGHIVVATGNPALIPDLNPDLMLLDLHLSKVNPWKVMQLVRKKSARVVALPFIAYANEEGNIRLVIGPREERGSLSFQAFKSEMNTFLNAKPSAEKGNRRRKPFPREAERPGAQERFHAR